MDLHYRQEVTVGALVLAGIAVFVAGTTWLSGRQVFGGNDHTVLVAFADVGTLKRGNPVKLSGVTLGSVENIRFEDFGRVIVTLSLDERVVPKTDASARMTTVGLAGDVQIDFNPGTSTELLPPGTVIQAESVKGMFDVGASVAARAESLLARLEAVNTEELSRELSALIVSSRRVADLLADPERGPMGEMNQALDAVETLAERLDSVVAGPALGHALANMDSAGQRMGRLADQYATTGARLDSILMRINNGEGTLGRAVTDTTLYVELRELSASLKAFVDTLRKNPGKITLQFRVF